MVRLSLLLLLRFLLLQLLESLSRRDSSHPLARSSASRSRAFLPLLLALHQVLVEGVYRFFLVRVVHVRRHRVSVAGHCLRLLEGWLTGRSLAYGYFSSAYSLVELLLPVLTLYSVFVRLDCLVWLLNDLFKNFFFSLFFLENLVYQVLGVKASRNE